MQITLPPEFEKFVEERVKAGDYRSVSEVVKDGLVLLRERDEEDRLREQVLRSKLAASLEESERDDTLPFDESSLEEIRAECRC